MSPPEHIAGVCIRVVQWKADPVSGAESVGAVARTQPVGRRSLLQQFAIFPLQLLNTKLSSVLDWRGLNATFASVNRNSAPA